ncbi:MAG: GlsB/YeaQ/YmgE family stress response membrane protein [Bryobacteraceae bacterium]|nr:GlsB/YeaQ/YmgE family stress response membrane protein [Bryobacteraceae bacterium]MDW8378944.1 GlsB/YeaQ/YmgE family stress response membrane protein [Bryobacterales bacterium]
MFSILFSTILGIAVALGAWRFALRGDRGGLWTAILLGVTGSLLGGMLGWMMGWYAPMSLTGFLASVLGGVILLDIYAGFEFGLGQLPTRR